MGQDIGLAILYLTALAAYLSLAWQIWCAGRWLYRNVYLMHPTYGEADRYARKYLIKPPPHPLWVTTEPSTVEEFRATATRPREGLLTPPLTLEETEEAFHIPAGPSRRLNAKPSGASTDARVDMGPTLPPTTSTPRTEDGSKSIVPPGPATSSECTAGPGDQWSRTTT